MAELNLTASRQSPLTMRMEHIEQAGETIARIVARFNRKPTMEEAAARIAAAFRNDMVPIKGSFRERRKAMQGSGVLASGFVKKSKHNLPKEKAEAMTQIAKNVYMDSTDQSIWQIEGDHIVKTATDDLQEIMSYPDMAPTNPYKPETAAVHVASLDARPHLNTRYVCFVDPELARVSFGAQVSEDRVFDRKHRQLVDVAENLVVDTANLRGMDRIFDYESTEGSVDLANAGETEYAAYYDKVYDFHKPYFKTVERNMADKMLM